MQYNIIQVHVNLSRVTMNDSTLMMQYSVSGKKVITCTTQKLGEDLRPRCKGWYQIGIFPK